MSNASKRSNKGGRVAARVPKETERQLEAIAAANQISVSDVVRMALLRMLPSFEQGNSPMAMTGK